MKKGYIGSYLTIIMFVIFRSESLTQALINRYDSDMEEEDEDKNLRISSLEQELVRQEQLVLDLKRRMNN